MQCENPHLNLIFQPVYIGAFAQSYAVIQDKDGFVNVRKGPGVNTGIIGKLYANEIFSYDDQSKAKSEWVKIYRFVSAKPDGNMQQGYISKTRLMPLTSFTTISNKSISGRQCTIHDDSISVTIKNAAFIVNKHKLSYLKNDSKQLLVSKIDGRPFWGTDNEIPKTGISSITVTINNYPVTIPSNAFNDLYEPSFTAVDVYLGTNNTIYIKMNNGDGAGAYTVIWIIKNNKYLKRFIDNSEA